MPTTEPNTYALDSMAMPLPYLPVCKNSPLVFRLMVTLREEIDIAALKQAVLDLAPRFPIMYTRLRRGFVWHRLEDAADFDIVRRDEGYPCRPFDIFKGETPLLRVLYRKRAIGIECTHLTCDGNGGSVYLNSLAARYLELLGHSIEKCHNVLDHRDKPSAAELEDYYRVAYQKKGGGLGVSTVAVKPAFLGFRERRPDYLQVTKVVLPLDELKRLTCETYGGCTITQYLCAVYASAFLKLRNKRNKPLRLSVPTNLRNYWDTCTLRNFVGMAHINVKVDKPEFREVLAVVRREMEANLSFEKQQELVNQSIRVLELWPAKIIPGFVKRSAIFLGAPFVRRFRWPHSSTLSNVGYIKLPPSLAEHITNYTFHIGEMDTCRITCCAAGCGNALTVVFSAVNDSTVIQDFCVDFLRREGLRLTCEQSEVCGA